MIQDLLDYAQIKAGKFRKNIEKFNIRTAIEDVMSVQRQKALELGIAFFATFKNTSQNITSLIQKSNDKGDWWIITDK